MPTDFKYTVDELVSIIKRSSLPTLVVEGKDDMIIYRRLEDLLHGLSLDVLPAGCRSMVLATFVRRHEYTGSAKVFFLADLDSWCILGVPHNYTDPDLLFTDGYSIENDVFRDTAKALMTRAETADFERELRLFVEWYALAFSRYAFDPTNGYRDHPNHFFESPSPEERLALRAGEVYPHELRDRILSDYGRLLRGKSLIGLLMRQFSKSGRPSHSIRSLFDHHAVRSGPLLTQMVNAIRDRLPP